MADRTTIDTIWAVHPDTANDVVHSECSTGSDLALLDPRAGAVSTLTLGLLQAGRAFKNNSEGFTGQPLQLTGAELVALEDGRMMLSWSWTNRFVLSLIFQIQPSQPCKNAYLPSANFAVGLPLVPPAQ